MAGSVLDWPETTMDQKVSEVSKTTGCLSQEHKSQPEGDSIGQKKKRERERQFYQQKE